MKLDPTRTKLLRDVWSRKLRSAYRSLNAAIRRLLIDQKVFGVINAGEWEFLGESEQIQRYADFLDAHVQQNIEIDWGEHTDKAYAKGLSRGYTDSTKSIAIAQSLQDQALFETTRQQFISLQLRRPPIQEKVKILKNRVLTDLKGVNQTMSARMQSQLIEGFQKGEHPRTIAKRLTSVTDKIGKVRAETIARTEVIRAHSEGQLDAMESMGVQTVGVQVEWSTAGDDRVCPQCSPMEGKVFKIRDARGLIPLHPRCRCAWLPYVPEFSAKKQRRKTTIRRGRTRSRALAAQSR